MGEIMRKLPVILVLLGMLIVTAVAQAQDTRTFEPLDRSYGYHFDYPLQTHSVRTSNVERPATVDVAFGALIAVEPNDSYLYADGAQPTYLTRMRVLAGFNTDLVPDNVDLTQYLGTSPLLAYDKTGATIESITLGGQPAVRATGIPVTPGEGSTDIITVFDGLLYEIVIEPVPLHLGFDPVDTVVLDPVYKDSTRGCSHHQRSNTIAREPC